MPTISPQLSETVQPTISGCLTFEQFAAVVEAAGYRAVKLGKRRWLIEGAPHTVVFHPRAKHMPLERALWLAKHGKPTRLSKLAPTWWKRAQFRDGILCPTCGAIHKPCALCGKNLAYHEATVDHIQPRSWGGSDAPENYQLLCERCNTAKGNSWRIDDRGLAQ